MVKRKYYGAIAASVGILILGHGAFARSSYDRLNEVTSDSFRFAIIADPQVSQQTSRGKVAYNATVETERAAAEINAMDPRPDFVIHLGDLVNTFNPGSEANYRRLTGLFEPPNIFVHGNHDTKPPYKPFLQMQKDLTGIDKPYSSFDVGQWHFVITPCNLPGNSAEDIAMEEEMLVWLEDDLEKNKDRPTVFFNHLHFMPQGLSQTEFYHFPLELRKKLLDLMSRYGNVKYYFNGHVHNGLQTAERTSWEYKGIKFLSVPTIIQPRPYGEEFAGFEEGIERGGYYLIVDADGDKLTLRGRLTGVDKEVVYPETFKPFSSEEYPRHFSTIPQLKAKQKFENGSFEDGLSGWTLPQRYNREADPYFVAETGPFAGRQALRLMIKSPVQSGWAEDEYYEVSQIVPVDPEHPLSLSGEYFIPETPKTGGAYMMAILMSGTEFKGLMMFRWSQQEKFGNYLPRAYGYGMVGKQQSWLYFQQLGKKKQGMFWKLPQETGAWHSLKADLSALYDEAHGAGAYRALKVDKVVFASGIWNLVKRFPSKTENYFANLKIENEAVESAVDGKALSVDDSNFTCSFGQALADELSEGDLRRAPVRTEGNLIANGDFSRVNKKSGLPVRWSTGRWKAFAEVSAESPSSAYSIKISDSDSSDPKKNGWWVSDKIGMRADADYEIAWRWKFQDASDAALMVRYFDRNGGFVSQDRFQAAGSQAPWKQEQRKLKTPEGCRLADVVLCTSAKGSGKIWLDDLVFEAK